MQTRITYQVVPQINAHETYAKTNSDVGARLRLGLVDTGAAWRSARAGATNRRGRLRCQHNFAERLAALEHAMSIRSAV